MFDLIKHLAKNDIQHTVSDNGNITVTNDLNLEDVSDVDALPDNLTVGDGLDLRGTSITTLPDNLTVGGGLYLRGTSITTLPDHFSCNSLYLEAERISNIAYRKNCGYSSRTIFAAWTGKEFRIAAG
ncbi:hypothetical protein CSQ32_001732 [Salmonella enterica subsp. diarizonae]|nr:hypothetical protein [Salmonella enterica subsp. diarizonae]ECR4176181.1 hypothetical protein [Salmonella enterica]ECE6623044.1 hypothetical protein [Salmonella enterica subsp. diarizonae]ECI3667142.1 hypothetical protein [Salmonella enterica subsp. diarizonae]ECJ1865266.1 hypothetical protein [Salmonella enterica subsp. diarizonae]